MSMRRRYVFVTSDLVPHDVYITGRVIALLRHLICKQISAILNEKGRFLQVFIDLVNAAIKNYSNEHAPQFS